VAGSDVQPSARLLPKCSKVFTSEKRPTNHSWWLSWVSSPTRATILEFRERRKKKLRPSAVAGNDIKCFVRLLPKCSIPRSDQRPTRGGDLGRLPPPEQRFWNFAKETKQQSFSAVAGNEIKYFVRLLPYCPLVRFHP
jgi:hypothetical protein